jgi:hypothetical protein
MFVAGSFVSILSLAAALSQAPAHTNTTGAVKKTMPSHRQTSSRAVQVSATDGSPASQASVNWVKWQGESFDFWGAAVRTDATGRGEIETLSGQVELSVYSDQGATATVLVEVPAGGTAAATVRLSTPEQAQ